MAEIKSFIIILLILVLSVPIFSLDNVIKIKSNFGEKTTINRLEKNLEKEGFKNIRVVDYKIKANSIGKKIRPITLILFDKISLELKLIKLSRLSALEFPFKILVTKDVNGRVWVSYENFSQFRKYGIPNIAVKKMNSLVRRVINHSVRKLIKIKKLKKLKRQLEKN